MRRIFGGSFVALAGRLDFTDQWRGARTSTMDLGALMDRIVRVHISVYRGQP